MKVKLGTISVGAVARRAINNYYGRTGLARVDDVRRFMIGHASADLDAVVADWQKADPSDYEYWAKGANTAKRIAKGGVQ